MCQLVTTRTDQRCRDQVTNKYAGWDKKFQATNQLISLLLGCLWCFNNIFQEKGDKDN